MPRHTAALVPDLDCAWRQLDLDGGARWQRRGVGVGLGFDATLVIQLAKTHVDQIEALTGQWQQMLALDFQRFTDGLLATANNAPQVFLAGRQQHGVELVQIAGTGTRWFRRKKPTSPSTPPFS